ncbi:hypothetical protein PQR39_36350 [Paraburkholderia sediminicola]|uniref:hypothetical protein n=1 Tax=Paraburkholderia sediminicola TaxID=458836 RepID=UPI0038BC9133
MGKGTRSNRDDFSPKIKLVLAKRVSFHCSLCDAPTVGPQTGTADEEFSVGKAAHIKAAAPGGPRYDEEQTPEERSSIKNGIWACATCADIIDRDEAAYTVADLHQLKDKAERLARQRVGRAPTAQFPIAQTPSAIQRAVQLFCLSEAERQEQLDPRFSVSVDWSQDGPVYALSAREPVAARLIVGGKDKHHYLDALRDVLDYGGSQSFENIDVRMEGSPLFPGAEVACKRLQIATEARPVSMTVEFGAEPDSAVFVELSGEASHGQKGLRFTGSAFAGLLTTTLTTNHRARNVNFTFHFDLQQWIRKPLLRLPHFARLKQVAQCLTKGTPVKLRLSLNGVEAELGSATFDNAEYFRGLRAFLLEVDFLRKLDTFFGLNLVMPVDLDDVLRDATETDELLSMIEVDKAEKPEVSATLIPSEPVNKLVDVIEGQHPSPIQLKHPVTLRVLGNSYGPFDVAVSCPHAVLVPVGPANIVPGKPVQLLLRAMDGHHWTAQCLR